MASSVFRSLPKDDILQRVAGFAARLRAARGRQRLLIAAGLGAVSALGFAPSYVWPLWFLTFPSLVWLIDGTATARRPWIAAAQIGWAFGFAYFLISLHWVGFAFVVDSEKHGWLLPFVALIFPGGLALFFAGATALARLRWEGPLRVLILACSITAFEWLRGHVLTGLPWNLPGNVWSGWDVMFQSVSLFGIYGLSLVTLAVVLAPAALIGTDGKRFASLSPLVVSGVLLFAMFVFGWLRVPAGPAPVFDDTTLRIVQPNVAQADKWKPEFQEPIWRRLIDLTRTAGLETRTVVIWPEAAPPFLLLREQAALQVLAQILPDRTSLLTGTVRIEGEGASARFFNSMAAVTGDGRVLAVYDKSHLVPFGEYLPFFGLLESIGISKITGGKEGYSEGPGVKTFSIPNMPAFGPLICYEVIFPGAVVESGHRPAWLVTMTDDSWFGPWTGPYQHLAIAKIRAAEEGLAIVRAANTGVSAVIDPYGRVVSSLGLDQTGILDGVLPKPLESTLFARFGDWLFALMLAASSGVGYFFSRSTSFDS